MSEFRKFQSFFAIEDAEEFASLLKEEGIDSIIEKDFSLDTTIAGESLDKKFHVKVKVADFERINSLLEKYAEKSLADISEDHYLLSFTDEELLEVLKKPDEWGKQDYFLSKQILKKRGHEISNQDLEDLKQKRLADLSRPESGMNIWVIIGYISSLFGGLFGIFIGSALISAKKTLPDGQIVYLFDERSRKHGKIILYLGSVVLILSILFFLNWLFLTLLFSNRLHFGFIPQSLSTQALLFL